MCREPRFAKSGWAYDIVEIAMKRMLAVAAAAALSVALQGQAAPTSSPVTIDYCAFNPWSFTSATASIMVHYHVTGSVAANGVAFAVRWGDGYVSTVNDAGQFSPDVAIDHYLNFSIMPPITAETYEQVDLAVSDVHLSNGTVFEGPFAGVDPVHCEIIRGAGLP